MANSARITVTPPSCLMDEDVRVKMEGLEESTTYTLRTSVTDSAGVPFFTLATYKSDEEGTIDLTKTPALAGHFKGLLPMAPFGQLVPERQQDQYAPFTYGPVTEPIAYQLEVYKGPVAVPLATAGVGQSGLTPVCGVTHLRRILGEGCTRTPVRHGRVRGSLLLPPGKGPFPGLVDIMGSHGGLIEERGALLASRGFAVICVAYFAYEDLPKALNSTFEMAYFEEAMQFLLSREEVCKDGVGVICSSKGSEYGLCMATSMPQVKATVVVNGLIVHNFSPTILLDGTQRPVAQYDFTKNLLLRGGLVDMYYAMEDPSNFPESIIPVEEAYGDILWLCSLDDHSSVRPVNADVALERCQKAGKADKVKVMKFPGAGHILEQPNIVFCPVTRNPVLNLTIFWGGHIEQHCAAQEASWKAILAFFSEKLK